METEQLSILLEKVNGGDTGAFEQLVSVTYVELRKIAGSTMRNHANGHTLQPTALVNEAYLRLASGEGRWENRAHFFGAAARAMRQGFGGACPAAIGEEALADWCESTSTIWPCQAASLAMASNGSMRP